MKEKPEKPIPGSAKDVREHTPPPRPITQGIDIEKLSTTASESAPKSSPEETNSAEKEGAENGAEKMNAELLAVLRTEQKRAFESAVSTFANDQKAEDLKPLVGALTPLKETFQAEAHHVGKDGKSQSHMNKKVAGFAKMMSDLAASAAAGTEDAVKDAIVALRKGAELFGASVSFSAGETAGTRSASEQSKEDLTERIKALLPAEGKIILEDRGKAIQVEPTEMAVIIERHVSNILTKSEARIPGYILDVAGAIKDEELSKRIREFLFNFAKKEKLIKEVPLIKDSTNREELLMACAQVKELTLLETREGFKAGPISGADLVELAKKFFERCGRSAFLKLSPKMRRKKAGEILAAVDFSSFRTSFMSILENEGVFAEKKEGETEASENTGSSENLEGKSSREILEYIKDGLENLHEPVPVVSWTRRRRRYVRKMLSPEKVLVTIEETIPRIRDAALSEGTKDRISNFVRRFRYEPRLAQDIQVLLEAVVREEKEQGDHERKMDKKEVATRGENAELSSLERERQIFGKVTTFNELKSAIHEREKACGPFQLSQGGTLKPFSADAFVAYLERYFAHIKSIPQAHKRAQALEPLLMFPVVPNTVHYQKALKKALKAEGIGTNISRPNSQATYELEPERKDMPPSSGIRALEPEGKYEKKERVRTEKNKEAKDNGVEDFFKEVRTWRGLWEKLREFEDKATKESEGEKRDRAIDRSIKARSGCIAAYRELEKETFTRLSDKFKEKKLAEICSELPRPFDRVFARVAAAELSLKAPGTPESSGVHSKDKDKPTITMETAPGGAPTTEKPKPEEKKTEAPKAEAAKTLPGEAKPEAAKAEERAEVFLSDADKEKASKDFDLGKVQKDPKFMEFLGKLSNVDEIINAPAGLEKLYNNFQKKEEIMDAIQEIHGEDLKKRLGIEIGNEGFADMNAFIEKKVATDPLFITVLEKQVTAYQVKKKREATMEDKVAKTASEGNYHNEFAKLKEVKKEKEALSLLKLSSRPIIGRLVRWYHAAGRAWEGAFNTGAVEKQQEFLEENQKKIDDANEALEINKNDKKAKADLEYALQKKREAQAAIADLTSSTRFMERLDEAKGLAAEKGWGKTKQELSAKIKEKRKEFKDIRKGIKEIRKRRNELYGKQGEVKEKEQEIFERGFPTAALFKAARLKLDERVKTLLDPKNASLEDIREANRLLEEGEEMGAPEGDENLMSQDVALKAVEGALYRSFKEALAEGEEKAYEKAALEITKQLTPIYKKGEIRERLKQTFEKLEKETTEPGRRASAAFLKRTLQRKFGTFTA